jgi:uncharacterized coiled-coil protein SlyX
MNSKTLASLKKEEELNQEIIDSWKHIKDLEAELEFLYVRESGEVEYIERLKNVLDNLYERVDTLKHEIK